MAPDARRDRAEMSFLVNPTEAPSTATALRSIAVTSAGVTQHHFPLW